VKDRAASPVVRVEGVSFAHGLAAQAILQQISFVVDRGDRLAIVGISGAGKTTLLRLLNRLSEPTQGCLYWEQRPFAQVPVQHLRQQIVLVLQESKLLGMTVQQALTYPLSLRQLSPVHIQQRISEWTERLQIPAEWLGRTEQQLSVGQRQWVAIARALVIQPQVLLLDEPTAALDIGRSHLILDVLNELTQTRGMAVLMANHQLDLAAKFCDRVLHLHQGSLLQDVPAHLVNWHTLEQDLAQISAQQVEEWE
jgi:D-methionine transport system ATP-binding protein